VLATPDILIGARDPHGIRPMVLGKRKDRWYLASESCALTAVGAETVRDIAPGEVIFIDSEGPRSIEQALSSDSATCVFEYIYFARPDSRIDGISVMEGRLAMGKELAKEWNADADIVCGVPDSGVPAALGFARESGISYGMGFMKNHYVGRTFIHPDQEMRERAVSVKLSVLKDEVKGKRVILIDDSIVRGTTSRRLVSLLRDAGAKEVHFGVVSPPVTSPCYFGIDTPVAEDLIAHSMDSEAICKVLGADSLRYLSLEGLKKALARESGFCLGCLTGKYPMPPHQLRGAG
jgi:amidophosphoribosyltransferase